jgi:HD superfamily phosphodiesterase
MGEASRRESREFVLATKADRQGAIVKMKSRHAIRLTSGAHQARQGAIVKMNSPLGLRLASGTHKDFMIGYVARPSNRYYT